MFGFGFNQERKDNVEWHQLIQGALASSPLALVLGFACHRLWSKLEAKDAELAALNKARVEDLLQISKQND